MEVIRHDGTVTAILDWIRPLMPGVHVASKLGKNHTETTEALLVFRTGGAPGTIRTDRPLVTVEAWAATETRADQIMGTARGLLLAAGRDGLKLGGRQLYGVTSAGGVADLPDPETSQPRCTWLCEVHIAGVVTEV